MNHISNMLHTLSWLIFVKSLLIYRFLFFLLFLFPLFYLSLLLFFCSVFLKKGHCPIGFHSLDSADHIFILLFRMFLYFVFLKLVFRSKLELHSESGLTFWQYFKNKIVYLHQEAHSVFLSPFL